METTALLLVLRYANDHFNKIFIVCHAILLTYSMKLRYTQMIHFGNNFFCHDVQCLFCANDHSNKFFIICLAILITCTYLNMVALHVSLKFSGKNLSKLWTHKKGNKYGHRKNSAENEEILCRNSMLYLWFFQTSLLESF